MDPGERAGGWCSSVQGGEQVGGWGFVEEKETSDCGSVEEEETSDCGSLEEEVTSDLPGRIQTSGSPD